MAEAREPERVKLIAGLLAGRIQWLDAAVTAMTEALGSVDLTSEDIPFVYTDYYTGQMGSELIRRFVAFDGLIDPASLAGVKQRTNAIEGELATRFDGPARPVNIDPGYVAPSKLVLASMKDFSHRIYLRDGVHGEITLQFRSGKWESLPWTFPDYGSGVYDTFLTQARDRLRLQAR